MRRVKQASRKKRKAKVAVVKVLGATGLGLSLVGSASASTMSTAATLKFDDNSPNQRFVLGEEEMADVSLATFQLFDTENFGKGVQLARGGHGCGGCRGCGGRGGFRGCGHAGSVGCRGCGGFRGCGGCGGCAGCGGCGVDAFWFGNFSSACCGSWGRCRLC